MEDIHPIHEEIIAMRRLLGSWLANPGSGSKDLIDWLQGYDLPVSESGEEPYVWLLRGLPLTHQRAEARRRFAERVAAALKEQPDVRRPGRRPEQVLYNLLMLGADLAWPEELAGPLYEMYERSVLSGSYLGLDLRNALRSALAENQLDNRLEREWFAILEGRRDAKLPGNPFQGYYGILLMPASPSKRGRPNLNALGKALQLMAHHLERQDNRWQEFERLRNKIQVFGEPLPYEELLFQSQEHRWPAWAILCLISLATCVDDSSSDLTGFAWLPLTEEMPEECTHQTICKYHHGNVGQLRAPQRTWQILLEIAKRVEPDIRKAPYSYSFDALREALDHVDVDTGRLVATG